jgi:uncharacterized protein
MTSTTIFISQESWSRTAPLGTLGFMSRYARAKGTRPAWRLALKIARRPNRFSAWLETLESYRTQLNLAEDGLHSFAVSPLRPYLRAGLTFDQRWKITSTHHAAVGSVLSVDIVRSIWARRPTKLGIIEGRRSSSFALWLNAAEYPREGALEIMLTRETPDGSPCLPLARVTFSLAETTETGNQRTLLIGGLQGSPRANGKRAIIEATRDLRGLRPKAAVFVAAQAFAAHADCKAILAVSDANHVIHVQSEKTVSKKAASYDLFWQERGGLPHRFLGYELPTVGGDERLERKAIFDRVASAFAAASNFG